MAWSSVAHRRWSGMLGSIPAQCEMTASHICLAPKLRLDNEKRQESTATPCHMKVDAIRIPAMKTQEINEKMVCFYLDKEGTEVMGFLPSAPVAPRLAGGGG